MFNFFTFAHLFSTSDDTLATEMIGVEQRSGSKCLKRSLLVTHIYICIDAKCKHEIKSRFAMVQDSVQEENQ